jgi:cellulose synthase operon protein YhjU
MTDEAPAGELNHAEHRHTPDGIHPPIGNRRSTAEPFVATATLGRWSFYFVVKLGLYWAALISFHPLPNLLFAGFILIPAKSRLWQRVKNVITSLVALILLYYDSWLPPVGRLIAQVSLLSEFSFSYLIELLSRFVSFGVIAALCASWVVYWVLSRWLRAGVLVIVCMLVIWVVKSPALPGLDHLFGSGGKSAGGGSASAEKNGNPDLDGALQNFFDKESQRSVIFTPPPATEIPFDVIFIHVCSLSWDDVRAVGLDQHPLWQRFDILLTKFNSAASYSGPAAIHMLRATCGQQKHGKMYQPTAENCYLMNNLQKAGFQSNFAMNHNGKFDDFLGQVQIHGRLTVPPLSLSGLEIAQYAFDESPIYDDLAVLNHWASVRQKAGIPRVALFYNTVSMHDGNHNPGTHSESSTLKTYGDRLARFLDEMEDFLQTLERSGRRAVVVMVPEHGAALRGDKRQISGLREIPTPAISLVPVGIKVIGGNAQRVGDPLVIDQSTSFLAVSHIVERMLEKSPFDDEHFTPSEYVVDLPATPFVAQNEKTTVLEYKHRYYLNRGLDEWEDYTEFNAPVEKE